MELRKEGWECGQQRGICGELYKLYFKRKDDDIYQWIIGIKEEDINKNNFEGEKETIRYSVGIHFG